MSQRLGRCVWICPERLPAQTCRSSAPESNMEGWAMVMAGWVMAGWAVEGWAMGGWAVAVRG